MSNKTKIPKCPKAGFRWMREGEILRKGDCLRLNGRWMVTCSVGTKLTHSWLEINGSYIRRLKGRGKK